MVPSRPALTITFTLVIQWYMAVTSLGDKCGVRHGVEGYSV